jgi:hypothetical protein
VAVAWIRMNARKFHRLNKKLREKGFSKNRCKTFLSYTQSFLEYAKKQPENLTEEDIRGYIARYPNNGHLKSYLKFYYTEILGKSLTSKFTLYSVPAPYTITSEEHTIQPVLSPVRDASQDIHDKLIESEKKMEMMGYKESTIEKYLRSVKEFIEFTNKPIEELIEPDIINNLNEQHISSKETVNAIKAALRFFFIIILGKNISVLKLKNGHTFKEPVVLNKDEIVKRLEPQKEMRPRESGRFYCIKSKSLFGNLKYYEKPVVRL